MALLLPFVPMPLMLQTLTGFRFAGISSFSAP